MNNYFIRQTRIDLLFAGIKNFEEFGGDWTNKSDFQKVYITNNKGFI